jgi:serine/threonine-protein kinase
MVPEIGQHFGHYEIRGEVGVGGMGKIFRAYDSRLFREVAIKLLRRDFEMSGMRERFLREARAASALNNPHIAAIYDVGEHAGEPYMVMELLQGENLRERIARGGISIDEIIAVGAQTADALDEAHAHGVVHRDIKPANIFLTRKSNGQLQVKILDFGLAKVDHEEVSIRRHLTAEGSTVGTVAYMSPEQARGEVLDGRSDLFSLGAVLYEMATGEVPFTGATSAVVFVALLGQDPKPIRALNKGIPRELEKVVFKALAKDRPDRYQRASDMQRALEQIVSRPAGIFSRQRKPFSSPMGKRSQSGVSRAISASGSAGRADSDAQFQPHQTEVINRDGSTGIPAFSLNASISHSRVHPFVHAIGGRRATIALFSILSLLVAAGFFYRYFVPPHRLIPDGQAIFVGDVQNQTGDPQLDGVVGKALAMDLQQSTSVRVIVARPQTSDRLGGPVSILTSPNEKIEDTGNSSSSSPPPAESPFNAAAHAQAMAYVAGSVSKNDGDILLQVDVFSVKSGATIATVSETAPDAAHIFDAVDRVTTTLRQRFGEPQTDIERTAVPFVQMASASLPAVSAFTDAEAQLPQRNTIQAIRGYKRATALDPNFAFAFMRLAEVYASVGDDGNAYLNATHAVSLGVDLGERENHLLNFDKAIYSGEWEAAAGEMSALAALSPHDPAICYRRAMLEIIQAQYEQARVHAEEAISTHPGTSFAAQFDAEALLGLDRTDTAFSIESASENRLAAPNGLVLQTAYILGNQDLVEQQAQLISSADGIDSAQDYGLYLDNSGQWTKSLAAWHSFAQRADKLELPGVAANLLAQAAYDRALADNCSGSMDLVHQADAYKVEQRFSQVTGFYVAITYALCGDHEAARSMAMAMDAQFNTSVPVHGIYVPEILAAADLASGHPESALQHLESVRQSPLISIVPYLSGRAHADLHQPGPAIADLQQVIEHRGAYLLNNSAVYAPALDQVARAYAALGDSMNSTDTYRRLLQVRQLADANDALLIDARAHLRN